MKKGTELFLHWLPKILAMILILMVLAVSFDVFEPGMSAGQIALALFLHLIPALILIIVLALSWKNHLLGAVLFVILDYLYLISMLAKGRPIQQLFVLALLLILISICFLISYSRKAKYARAINKNNP